MKLYLAIGGGQWAKHIAPNIFKENINANIPGECWGGLELVSKTHMAAREYKSKGEYP